MKIKRNPASRLLRIGCKSKTWGWRHNSLTWRHRQFFNVFVFPLLSLVTGPSFMLISSVILVLWQFPLIREWKEIWNPEISPSGFCPIFEDRGELGILNLARMFLIRYWRKLWNVRVTSFTVSELLRDNQTGERENPCPRYTQIIVNNKLITK